MRTRPALVHAQRSPHICVFVPPHPQPHTPQRLPLPHCISVLLRMPAHSRVPRPAAAPMPFCSAQAALTRLPSAYPVDDALADHGRGQGLLFASAILCTAALVWISTGSPSAPVTLPVNPSATLSRAAKVSSHALSLPRAAAQGTANGGRGFHATVQHYPSAARTAKQNRAFWADAEFARIAAPPTNIPAAIAMVLGAVVAGGLALRSVRCSFKPWTWGRYQKVGFGDTHWAMMAEAAEVDAAPSADDSSNAEEGEPATTKAAKKAPKKKAAKKKAKKKDYPNFVDLEPEKQSRGHYTKYMVMNELKSGQGKPTSDLLAGKVLCFAGSFTLAHTELQVLVMSHGGTWTEEVDETTTHLVCTEKGLRSKKAKVAAELDVPIVNEDFIFEALGTKEPEPEPSAVTTSRQTESRISRGGDGGRFPGRPAPREVPRLRSELDASLDDMAPRGGFRSDRGRGMDPWDSPRRSRGGFADPPPQRAPRQQDTGGGGFGTGALLSDSGPSGGFEDRGAQGWGAERRRPSPLGQGRRGSSYEASAPTDNMFGMDELTLGRDEDAGDDDWAALFGDIQAGDAKRGDWGGAAPSGAALDSVALSGSESGSEDLMGDSIADSLLDEEWMSMSSNEPRGKGRGRDSPARDRYGGDRYGGDRYGGDRYGGQGKGYRENGYGKGGGRRYEDRDARKGQWGKGRNDRDREYGRNRFGEGKGGRSRDRQWADRDGGWGSGDAQYRQPRDRGGRGFRNQGPGDDLSVTTPLTFDSTDDFRDMDLTTFDDMDLTTFDELDTSFADIETPAKGRSRVPAKDMATARQELVRDMAQADSDWLNEEGLEKLREASGVAGRGSEPGPATPRREAPPATPAGGGGGGGAGLEGCTVAFAGKFSLKQDELRKIVESKGGKVSTTITKSVTHLVCSEKGKGTAKHKTAVEKGIEVVDEAFVM